MDLNGQPGQSSRFFCISVNSFLTILDSNAKRDGNYALTVGTEQQKRLFRHVVSGTQEVREGPLEYCGLAMHIKAPDGST